MLTPLVPSGGGRTHVDRRGHAQDVGGDVPHLIRQIRHGLVEKGAPLGHPVLLARSQEVLGTNDDISTICE